MSSKPPQNDLRRLILGSMRLSTEAERSREDSLAIIRRCLDLGIRRIDTADVYGPDDASSGHSEALIAEALSSHPAADKVEIISKGGLRREGDRWLPDGRAKHLRSACEASLCALKRETIDLYLLHLPDPSMPFATSVRALAGLKKEGKVARIGLSNVVVSQIEEARRHVEVDAVQVELGPLEQRALRNGVVEYCVAAGIEVLAHRPLGGVARRPQLAKIAGLVELATEQGHTVEDLALAWLLDLDPLVSPVLGVGSLNSADRSVEALRAWSSLDETARSTLETTFPESRRLRLPLSERRPPDDVDGEVVIVMGIPAAGKTSRVDRFVDEGYQRFNRDEAGGTLRGLLGPLDLALAEGCRRAVLDNTYGTRAQRAELMEVAWRHGLPLRCVWIDTPIADAQINAVERMLDRLESLPMPDELKKLKKSNPNVFPPGAQFSYDKSFEAPQPDEGFSAIEQIGFERRPWKRPRRALFFDFPKMLWAAEPKNDGVPELRTEALAHLSKARDEGRVLIALLWGPGLGSRPLEAAERETRIENTRRALIDALGDEIELSLELCPHKAGPPLCWCRKPLPGLALAAARRWEVDPAKSSMLVASAADRTLASRLGLELIEAEETA